MEFICGCLRLYNAIMAVGEEEGLASDIEKVSEQVLIKSLIWSVGACVDYAGRLKFDGYLRMLLSGQGLDASAEHKDFLVKSPGYNQEKAKRAAAMLPPGDSTTYDFKFSCKKCQW